MEADEPALGRKSADHWRYGLRIARRYRMDKGDDQHYAEPSCRQGCGKNRRHRKLFYPLLSRDEAVQQEVRNTLPKIKASGIGLLVNTMAQESYLSDSEIDELYRILKEGRREHE